MMPRPPALGDPLIRVRRRNHRDHPVLPRAERARRLLWTLAYLGTVLAVLVLCTGSSGPVGIGNAGLPGQLDGSGVQVTNSDQRRWQGVTAHTGWLLDPSIPLGDLAPGESKTVQSRGCRAAGPGLVVVTGHDPSTAIPGIWVGFSP